MKCHFKCEIPGIKSYTNREIVRSFVDDILIKGHLEKLEHYINNEHFTQHNPHIADGLSALRSALKATFDEGVAIKYGHLHRLLAEGNFVLAVSEGSLNGVHSSFYDLFRVSEGKLVEHWDTIETVPHAPSGKTTTASSKSGILDQRKA
ncbi:MAG: hypothetical protein HOE48_06415 [Candidatus Latescibacteria bacterium]|nr:hypothetical protein [Candidatus Latescibacterota bacterium]MBT4137530.1 hypothetical protein [Candidatus Latescibacterota bacterium]